jgi:hypothetical protein
MVHLLFYNLRDPGSDIEVRLTSRRDKGVTLLEYMSVFDKIG